MTDVRLGDANISKTFSNTTNTVQDGSLSYYSEEYNLVETGDFRQLTIDFKFAKQTGYIDRFRILADNVNVIYETSTIIESTVSHKPFNLTTFPGVKYKIQFLQSTNSISSLQYDLSLIDKGVAKSISNDLFDIFTINSTGEKFKIVSPKISGDSIKDIALSQSGKLYGVTRDNNIVQISSQTNTINNLGVFKDSQGSSIQDIKAVEFAKDGKMYIIGAKPISEEKTYAFLEYPSAFNPEITYKLHLYRVDDIESKTATFIGDLPLDLHNTQYTTKSSDLYTLDVANSRFLTVAGGALWQVPLSNPSSASKIGDGIKIIDYNNKLKNLVFENNELIVYNSVSGSSSFEGEPYQRIKIDIDNGIGVIDNSKVVQSFFGGTSIIPESLLSTTPPVFLNHAPTVANVIIDTTIPANDLFNFAVPTNTFIDPDVGDKLTYKATLDNGNPLPAWLKFDSTTQTFSGTPTISDVGKTSVKVTTSDLQNLSTSDIFDINVVKSAIVIKEVQFSEQSVNKSLGVRKNIHQTVDGNIVSIEVTLENTSDVVKSINLSATDTKQGLDISKGKKSIQIAAHSTLTTKIDWDTNGYAWGIDKSSDREILISAEDASSAGNSPISLSQTIKVVPKPLILVHGVNSTEHAFDNYVGIGKDSKNFLQSANSNWKGIEAKNIDTGNLFSFNSSFDFTASSIKDNAKQLGLEIEVSRYSLNAQHVDILAHSMGGLISRQYIQDFMAPSTSGTPTVSNLVMMGTPNGGSEIADFFVDSFIGAPNFPLISPFISPISNGTRELTTSYVKNSFNKNVKDTKGVPFSILSGNIKPFLAEFTPSLVGVLTPIVVPILPDSDGVVTVASTRAIPTENQHILALPHTSMPGDENAFQTFVLPLLSKDPTAVAKKKSSAASALGLEVASIQEQAAQPINTSLQAFFGSYPEVPATGSVEVIISVPAGSKLEIDYIGANSVSATLIDPNGKILQTIPAGTLNESNLFRGFEVASPIVGNYKLLLEQQQGVKSNVQIAAGVVGSPISLDIATSEIDLSKQIQLTATLTNGADPVKEATVKGTIINSDGLTKTLTLVDDGQHGDGIAGDGVYGAKSDTLLPDNYLVGIASQSQEFSRFASKSILVRGGNKANIFIKQTNLVGSDIIGESTTYTFEVGNIGPDKATGVTLVDKLSIDVDFVSASSGAIFDPNSRKVTFNLGEIASQSIVNPTLVVSRKKTGEIVNQAVVHANEFDINIEDNQINSADVINNPVPPLQSLTLQKATEDIWTANGSGKVKVAVTGKKTNQLNEIGVFKLAVDNTVNGIAVGAAGFAQAALANSTTLFTALPDRTTDGLDLSRIFNVANGDRLGFFMVANGTIEENLKYNSFNNVVFSIDPANPGSKDYLQVTEKAGAFTLDWEQGNDNTFQDLSVSLTTDSSPDSPLSSISSLQGQPAGEILDLRAFADQNLQATFTVKREAAYNNVAGFYKIDDVEGTVTSLTGAKLKPQDSGYKEAALFNKIAGLDIIGENLKTITIEKTVAGGAMYAPYLIINGNNPGFAANFVYTAFSQSNFAQADRVRLLGENTFGFEDLILQGGDFNDLVVQASFKTV